MSYFIHASKFFLKNSVENNGYLEITDDGYFGIYSDSINKDGKKIIDYHDKWIAPGLFDTHIHGLLNCDVTDGKWEDINKMSEGLLKAGVTSWLPTTVTESFEKLDTVCQSIGMHHGEETGAKIQGIHFEGPYLTEKHKGAQNPKYLRNPSIKEFSKWKESSDGLLNKITIAPERDNACEFTRELVKMNVVVSLGHSSATYYDAKKCVESGASMFTHMYNGMDSMGHRDVGMVGAAYTTSDTMCEIICDGFHNSPAAIDILLKQKGTFNTILVTDCMRAGLMPNGEYELGGLKVVVNSGTARLKQGGNLAGSVLLLKDALKNLVKWGIATPEQAIRMGTLTPAISMKMDDRLGSISPDLPADFIVLDDNMNLEKTYINGSLRYSF